MSDKVGKECAYCGGGFIPTQRVPERQVCCSNLCYYSYRYYRDKNKNQFSVEFRLSKLCSSAKARAKKYNRAHTIDKHLLLGLWESQGGRCAVSGRGFNLDYHDTGAHPDGPSLDRIDSSGGYTPSNVRLVTYHINTALTCFGEQALVQLAKDILENTGEVEDEY